MPREGVAARTRVSDLGAIVVGVCVLWLCDKELDLLIAWMCGSEAELCLS